MDSNFETQAGGTLATETVASEPAVRRAAAVFAGAERWRSLVQLATTFGPFLAGCVAMYLACQVSTLLALALALPTGALLLRVFIIQHDCGHGSFFASRRANTIVGRLCSLLTMTPYANWRRQHSLHHAHWNNFERQTDADLYSSCLTVRAYLALPRWRRLVYRALRHPLVANVVVPPLIFLFVYRVPYDVPRAWTRERWSVHGTNAALVALFATLALLLDWRDVLTVHLSVIAVASILGVWLFTLQHRFATAHWSGRADWRFVSVALEGSSWFDLPRVLHWLTGNIGFHHIHHLDPRVPNYRLSQAHDVVQTLRPVAGIGLGAGLAAPSLALWDERRDRLVRFRDAVEG
jgi:omega-6 fatty acid desaturase (delta-12 desaturase)